MSDLDRAALRRGLRLGAPDEARLAAENELLGSVEGQGPLARARVYWRLIGPGYLQSAMTLGGGTASACLFSGAVFGYELLWVAPFAMLLGIVMLSALSWQTLSAGQRPMAAMSRFAGRPIAVAWAIGTMLASILWHFPHYALAAALAADVADVFGLPAPPPLATGAVVLLLMIAVTQLYGRSPRLVRTYERLLKVVVWGIILCFGFVVAQNATRIDWGAVGRGFVGFGVPGQRGDIDGATVVLSGAAAAVGINMTFLYPYSLLARGWDRQHRRLARFDLWAGMFVPYVLATSLMIIAMASTLHRDGVTVGTGLTPVTAAQALGQSLGPVAGRLVFDLGLLGMVLSTMTLHMVSAGFACAELCGFEPGSTRHKLATLLPAPGVLGTVLWSKVAVWIVVPTSVVCGLLLPVAYLGFFLLHRSRQYLGDDRPRGVRGSLWLLAMLATTLIVIGALTAYVIEKAPAFFGQLSGKR